MEKQYQEFVFVVEDMSDEQAAKLMKLILDVVEVMDLRLGGGYHPATDADFPDFPEVGHG